MNCLQRRVVPMAMGGGPRRTGSLGRSRVWAVMRTTISTERLKVWLDLVGRELNDCREFHSRIREIKWHFKNPVALQSTWRRLMLLMMTFLGSPVERDGLRNYQRGA